MGYRIAQDRLHGGRWVVMTDLRQGKKRLRSYGMYMAALMLLAACEPVPSAARQQVISMDGSSTLFPLAEAFAEDFPQQQHVAIAVSSSSSSGGLNRLCHGELDIAAASRPITQSEMQQCQHAGVAYVELPVALDAIAVVVHPANGWLNCLSPQQLKQIWQPQAQGVLTSWQQIDPRFPAKALRLYGAGVSSGTYDYFTAAIVGRRHASRGDYAASEDDNMTVRGIAGDRQALGFMGLSYYLENKQQLKVVAIRQPDGQCRQPEIQHAQRGKYKPLTRVLFLYVSKAALLQKPVLQQFVAYMLDSRQNLRISGELGFIPLPVSVLQRSSDKLTGLQTGSVYDGGFAGNAGQQNLQALFAQAASVPQVTLPEAKVNRP